MGDDPLGTETLARVATADPARGLRLTVVSGPDAGIVAITPHPKAIIGRAVTADLRLTDTAVSSFHVELAASTEGIEVVDLESRNGTFHAGARLVRAIVPPAALLEMGASVVRVEPDAEVGLPDQLAHFGSLRGASASMRAVFARLARLAPSDLAILMEGETGTGKELAARAVHEASRCATGPFVVLDCTAIPPALAESVLFGHEAGAFPGASEARVGVFEAASGGTVFLDEVGELACDLQPKLLRVVETRAVVRIGGTEARPIRARVVSATCRDLQALVNAGTFRDDLYFRLAQARVLLPPLRERPEDIATLAYFFLQSLPAGTNAARLASREVLDELKRRDYPGNVRELRSTIERVALLAKGPTISLADLTFERLLSGERSRSPTVARADDPPVDAPAEIAAFREAKRTLVDEFERDYLQTLLARTGDNLSRASALSGVERHHLRDLLRKHGLRGS